MKIHEYQAKELFASYGIPVPRGEAAFGIDVRVPGMLFGTVVRSPVLQGTVAGFDPAPDVLLRFIAMPVLIGVMAGVGADVRFYRTVFLEESSRDFVRTARAKDGSTTISFEPPPPADPPPAAMRLGSIRAAAEGRTIPVQTFLVPMQAHMAQVSVSGATLPMLWAR